MEGLIALDPLLIDAVDEAKEAVAGPLDDLVDDVPVLTDAVEEIDVGIVDEAARGVPSFWELTVRGETSVLAAFVSPASAQPAGPLVPGLTPDQIRASQALAPKFDRSAEMEQARQATFKDRPLGAIVQKSFNAFANYLIVSAQMMPEPGYAFRPTPDVRTFGEQPSCVGVNAGFV